MSTWASVATTWVFIWYGSELYGGLGGAVDRLLTLLAYGWPVLLAVALTHTRITSASPSITP